MATSDITRVAGNIGAMNALNSLNNINKQLSLHQTRLSTGKNINSAADDPAGMTIASKMNAHSQGLTTALSNIGDAQNLLSVADSGISSLNDILTDMRNKSEAAASDTMGSDERSAIVTQLQADVAQIDDIASQTKWNGTNLIDGTYNAAGGKSLTFQTGDQAGDTTSLSGLENMSATGTGSLLLATKAAVGTNLIGTVVDSGATVFGGVVPTADTITPSHTSGAVNTNLSGLSSGTYTVKVTSGKTTNDGDTSTIQLLDASGKALLIGQGADATHPDGTGTVANSLTVDLHAGAQVVDFGNGLSVSLAQNTSAATTVSSATVGFTQAGSYSLKTSGTTGNVLSGESTAKDFSDFMAYVSGKMTTVSTQLSQVGALEDRLNYKSDQVTSAQTNVQGAYNRIMNADMASEQVSASKYQILQQTATAMLSQANSAPQFLLKLFQ
jgi:flagellin